MGGPVEALERIAEAKFEHVEIWGNPYGVLDGCSDELIRSLKDYGLEACSLHAPFAGLDISSIDEDTRKLSVKKILNTMEIAERLGCRHIVIHPGSAKYDRMEDYHNARKLLAASIVELAGKADEGRLALAVENMLVGSEGSRVGTTVAELAECLESVQVENVGICLDTGHAHYNGLEVSKETENAGDFLTALHVNDNDRSGDQHRVPGEGTINCQSFLRALKETAYKGVFMMEIYGEDEAAKTLEDSYRAASRLLGY